MDYSVYMHVNKTNGKRYIGITSQKPLYRWKNGLGYRSQKRFFCAIKSYGWDGFDHYVLFENLSKAEAERTEEELIRKYRSNEEEYGYNIENGGVIHKLSEEQKEHLREINTGKHHSEETKRKMSVSQRRRDTSWMKGRKHSEETRRKMSEKRLGENNPRAKATYQYTLDGRFVRGYKCMNEIKTALGLEGTSHISLCCAGKRKKAYGYMWSYERAEKVAPYKRNYRKAVVNG